MNNDRDFIKEDTYTRSHKKRGTARDSHKRSRAAGPAILASLAFLALSQFLYSSAHSPDRRPAGRQWENRVKGGDRQRETAAGDGERRQRAQGMRQEGESEKYEPPIDFTALRQINQETIAWLTIPGTEIDYPIVQTDNNDTYLTTGFDKNASASGAIYLDCDSDGALTGKHSIFYGHHMRDGSMFAELVKFKKEDFFNSHREIILYTPQRELRLRTVAALYGNADGEKRRTEFPSEEGFRQYIDEMTKNCAFRELPVNAPQRLYSFVTCSYEFPDARTIVYAVEEY